MKIRALNAVAHHVPEARRRTRFSTAAPSARINFIVHAIIFPLGCGSHSNDFVNVSGKNLDIL